MKLLTLSPLDLRALDEAFGGTLGNTLAAIVRSGFEPELQGIRYRPDPNQPSFWSIVVSGGSIRREFEANASPFTVGIASHLWLVGIIEELKADVTSGMRRDVREDEAQVQLSLWPRKRDDGKPS